MTPNYKKEGTLKNKSHLLIHGSDILDIRLGQQISLFKLHWTELINIVFHHMHIKWENTYLNEIIMEGRKEEGER